MKLVLTWDLLLTDDFAGSLECEFHNALIMISGRQVEYTEDVLPTRLDVCGLGVHHLSYTADYHVTDCRRPRKHTTSIIIYQQQSKEP